MAKFPQPKPCEFCYTPVTLRFRIQYDESQRWVLVCRPCWDRLSLDNPHYRYGGTWKAR